MRHVTIDDLKKQTIQVHRVPVVDDTDEVEVVAFQLLNFGAVEGMTNRIPFKREESIEMKDSELFEAAYKRFAANINFQLDYVAHITNQRLDD